MYHMAYKYRVYPTKEQRRFLAQTFGCARYVWNWAIEYRTNAYHGEGESLGFAAMCKRLTQLKKDDEHEWLKNPSSVVLQQSIRNQEQAFTGFFEGRAGYPSFKRKHGTQTARHTKAAFRYDADTRTLSLAKMPGTLKVNWSRDLRGERAAVTISKDPAGRYHVSIEFKAPVQDKPKTGKAVGVDVGLESYVALSTGEAAHHVAHLQAQEVHAAGPPRRIERQLFAPGRLRFIHERRDALPQHVVDRQPYGLRRSFRRGGGAEAVVLRGRRGACALDERERFPLAT